MKVKTYNHKTIEKKWQKKWQDTGLYVNKVKKNAKKCYVLDMFPYPSGVGLHVGHPKGFIGTDIYARFKHMQGYSVLHPMGWDAFGLPAENYALKNKIHPRKAVDKNIAYFKKQLSILGFSYDWGREIDTTDPAYYKWTQWAFLQMYKKGLAYESHEPINWCPSCKTGLANEDLESDGTCERCGSVVEKKPIRQWVLRITKYADRLLKDLESLKLWPRSVVESQKNWIGRSEGAEFSFAIKGHNEKIRVFTTRPDTLFGVTYVVFAPEHVLVRALADSAVNRKEIEQYIQQASQKDTIERTAEGREKSGVQIQGIYAINPANGEEIPVWIADYVLSGYGTGAVMAVPAHDERDFAFAKKYNLKIRRVVQAREGSYLIVEKSLDAQAVAQLDQYGSIEIENTDPDWGRFFRVTVHATTEKDFVTFLQKNLRIDNGTWYADSMGTTNMVVFNNHAVHVIDQNSFDEYIAHGKSIGIPVAQLDVAYMDSAYIETGTLVNSVEFTLMDSTQAQIQITKKFGKKKITYKLQDWVFSRQRYWGEPIPLVHCEACGVVPVPEKDLPVVLPNVKSYEPTGTGESPLAHIDAWVNTTCPSCKGPAKRETNTMPQWAGSCWYYLRFMDPHNTKKLVDPQKESFWSPVDVYVGGAEHATRHLIYARFWHKFLYDIGVVTTKEPFERLINQGLIMGPDGRKRSKRYGNVVNPNDIVEQFGADTMRVYEMFMGPFEGAVNWNMDSIVGARRFVERVWKMQFTINDHLPVTEGDELVHHQTLKKVTEDITNFSFNTAIAQMMIYVNHFEAKGAITTALYAEFIQILSPFAPHVTEEIWYGLGNIKSLYTSKWPQFDPKKTVSGTISVGVQVNGKVRATLDIGLDEKQSDIEKRAVELEAIGKWIAGKQIKKIIYVKGRIINIVAV